MGKSTSIDSRDVKLTYLYSKLMQNPDDPLNQLHLTEEIKRRQKVDHVFELFKAQSQHVDDNKEGYTNNYWCLKETVK